MTLWQWALVALGSWVGVSFVAALGIAAVLGRLDRVPRVFEPDWSSAPLARDGASQEAFDRAEDEEAILAALSH